VALMLEKAVNITHSYEVVADAGWRCLIGLQD
jgi:hypothetical protein